MYNGAYGRGDFGNAYLLPCLAALDGGNGGVSGGAIMAKVSHFSTQGRRQTTFGVPCPTVPNRFSFDPFLLGLRDNTEKSTRVRVCVLEEAALKGWFPRKN